jgi:ubiquinone/menaquinone biosynthesis C-methylase UbiE
MSIQRVISGGINAVIRPLGVQLVRGFTDDSAIASYVPARKTIAAARRDGLSLADYIDSHNAELGATKAVVTSMLGLSGLTGPVDRVCEIGPGTGRYAELVTAELQPNVYEMYETAKDWLPHLRGIPHAQLNPADGRTLAATASDSVDLVHAHKVFVYVPLITTVGYLQEMARVVRPGGAVAFDIVTENCMDEAATAAWVRRGITLYSMTPRQWTVDLLARHGLEVSGSSLAALSGGRTELMVFRKPA